MWITIDKVQRSTQQQGPIMKYDWEWGEETAGSLTPSSAISSFESLHFPRPQFPHLWNEADGPNVSFDLLLLCLHMGSPRSLSLVPVSTPPCGHRSIKSAGWAEAQRCWPLQNLEQKRPSPLEDQAAWSQVGCFLQERNLWRTSLTHEPWAWVICSLAALTLFW